MKLLQRMAALLLVAFWLPASSHALLEHFELIHHVHADHADHTGHDGHDGHDNDSHGSHEHDADNHSAADGHCLAPLVKTPLAKPVVVIPPAWLIVALLDAAQCCFAQPVCFGPSPPGAAPPELSSCWQFSFRAALPVRAPSLAS